MYDVDPIMPSSLQEYIDGIITALPTDESRAANNTHELASKLRCFQPSEIYPDKDESLQTWIESITRSDEPTKIMLILGESRGSRVAKKDRKPDDGKMIPAGTSDGIGLAIAIAGIMTNAGTKAHKISIDGGLDEWDQSVNEADKSHLIIVGTGEINIFATFLHGLVENFYFGNSIWPPASLTLGDQLYAGNPPSNCYHKNPEGSIINDYGAVLLLKNPWNPKFRVLWIAGLTGKASMSGCHQVGLNWRDHPHASKSIGVVFTHPDSPLPDQIKPKTWLVHEGSIPKWGKVLPPKAQYPRRVVSPSNINQDTEETISLIEDKRTRIFISYAHKDKKHFKQITDYISVPLENAGFELWSDTKIEVGEFWDDQIKENISKAHIALVLVSQSFLNSNYCQSVEITNFIELRKEKGLIIFPVVLYSCEWKEHKWLSDTQFLPRDGKTFAANFRERWKGDELCNEILTQLKKQKR